MKNAKKVFSNAYERGKQNIEFKLFTKKHIYKQVFISTSLFCFPFVLGLKSL